jgi:hypothetical protein
MRHPARFTAYQKDKHRRADESADHRHAQLAGNNQATDDIGNQ